MSERDDLFDGGYSPRRLRFFCAEKWAAEGDPYPEEAEATHA